MIRQGKYVDNIKNRSYLRFLLGLIPRSRSKIKNSYTVWVARRNGARIGKCVTMPLKLAQKANANLTIGNYCSIQTDWIDLRSKVEIGNKVIIGFDVEILTTSHDVDSIEWENKHYGIKIEDYAWIATKSFVLPSCRNIGKGAICAAGSVVFKNIKEMSIVTGNPAVHLRFRDNVHSNLAVESLLGNDLERYCKTFIQNL